MSKRNTSEAKRARRELKDRTKKIYFENSRNRENFGRIDNDACMAGQFEFTQNDFPIAIVTVDFADGSVGLKYDSFPDTKLGSKDLQIKSVHLRNTLYAERVEAGKIVDSTFGAFVYWLTNKTQIVYFTQFMSAPNGSKLEKEANKKLIDSVHSAGEIVLAAHTDKQVRNLERGGFV